VDKKYRIVIAACLILFTRALYAGDLQVIEKRDFTVVFQPSLRSAAQEVVDMYPYVMADLENIIGWNLDSIPSILLMKDRKIFLRMAESPLTVAFAVPEKNLIVIDYSRMRARPFSLGIMLKHELCHLLLHNHIRGPDFPRWLDEGV
jgi:hypothetical protein